MSDEDKRQRLAWFGLPVVEPLLVLDRRALVDPVREQLDDPPTSTSGTERYPFHEPPAILDSLEPSRHEPEIVVSAPQEVVASAPRTPRAAGTRAERARTARDVHRPGLIDEHPELPPDGEVPPAIYQSPPDLGRVTSLASFRGAPRVAQSLDLNDPMRPPWLAIDLDETLLTKVKGRLPSGQPALGEPMPGASELLAELAGLGWRVSIFTARFAFTDNEVTRKRWAEEIAQHLAERDLKVTDVWYGPKPPAHRFLDDRAIQFKGDFRAVLAEITSMGQGDTE